MDAGCAHVIEHIERPARLRHEQRLAQQRGPILGRFARSEQRKNVLDQHHPDDLVERLAINRQPRMAVLGKSADHFVPARGAGDGDDLAARDRHVIGIVLAEMEQVAQHLALQRGEIAVALRRAIFLVVVDRFFQLRAQRLVRLGQVLQAANHAGQPASTVSVSGRYIGHYLGTCP